MNDLGTLCMVAALIVIGLMVLPRLMNMFGSPYSRRGANNPEYDDPNIRSRGFFGGARRPQYDDPNIRSRGSFGRPSSSGSRTSSGSGSRVDSPKIRSRGGFGRSKD
ncbi:MAG: hypothetical protein CL610_29645 [Anaerolineaceae bacterium]|nr:hypothetical protein [Anaerolineaceae bacterium]